MAKSNFQKNFQSVFVAKSFKLKQTIQLLVTFVCSALFIVLLFSIDASQITSSLEFYADLAFVLGLGTIISSICYQVVKFFRLTFTNLFYPSILGAILIAYSGFITYYGFTINITEWETLTQLYYFALPLLCTSIIFKLILFFQEKKAIPIYASNFFWNALGDFLFLISSLIIFFVSYNDFILSVPTVDYFTAGRIALIVFVAFLIIASFGIKILFYNARTFKDFNFLKQVEIYAWVFMLVFSYSVWSFYLNYQSLSNWRHILYFSLVIVTIFILSFLPLFFRSRVAPEVYTIFLLFALTLVWILKLAFEGFFGVFVSSTVLASTGLIGTSLIALSILIIRPKLRNITFFSYITLVVFILVFTLVDWIFASLSINFITLPEWVFDFLNLLVALPCSLAFFGILFDWWRVQTRIQRHLRKQKAVAKKIS